MNRIVLVGLVVVAVLGGCAPAVPAGSPAGGSSSPEPLTVGLGYIPSVQFAQFYLADQQGYYRDAGLDVTFQNRIDPELVTLIGQGAVDLGMADGTSVIPAVSQDIPVRYVATIYGTFPNVVFARTSSGIASAADLRGRKVGTPGRFGSGWIMLQALLQSGGLAPDDIEVELFPDFGQASALQQGRVEAATGFVNNEPVMLELAGEDVKVLRVDDAVPLPGPGLTTSVDAISDKPEALRGFVAATLRAMEEIRADPERGLDAAVAAVPELAADRTTQRAILDATIASWSGEQTEGAGYGAIDRPGWEKSVEFMRGLPDSVLPAELPVDQLVTEELLPR